MNLAKSLLVLAVLSGSASALTWPAGAYISVGSGANLTSMGSAWNTQGSADGDGGGTSGGAGSSMSSGLLGHDHGTLLNIDSGESDILTNVAVNMAVGYNWLFSQNLVGIDLNYTNNSKVANVYDNIASGYTYHNAAYFSKQFALGLKLGRVFAQSNLIYIHPALAYGELNSASQIFTSSATTDLPAVNKNLWGAEIGLGYERLISQHFSLAFEADYINYQNYKTVDTAPGFSSPITSKYQPFQYRLNLSAVYHF
ncbi:MAG: hypothetical protein K0Q57_451 [Gammaproteobacteria bacterium]|jgi:hypothetical protein|nr:hypothetical protein [Gammaproteobacteria bacterium]